MNRYLLPVLLLLPLFAASQDIIILKNNSDTIFCSIIKDKIVSVDYKLPGDTTIHSIKTIETEGYLMGKYELSEEEQKQYVESIIESETEQTNVNTYNAGFYCSFQEFKKDTPGIEGVIIKEKKFCRRLTRRTFKLFIQDSLGNKIKYKEAYWGYSDGVDQYYQERVRLKRIFHVLKPVGDHYTFNKVIKHKLVFPFYIIPVLPGWTYVTWKNWTIRMIDSNTGNIHRLNTKTLRSIKIDDSDPLWEELIYFNSMKKKHKYNMAQRYYYNP